MDLPVVLITHVIGPAMMLVLVRTYMPLGRVDAIATALATALPLMFLWFAGRWHLTSTWFRYALPIAVMALAAITARPLGATSPVVFQRRAKLAASRSQVRANLFRCRPADRSL